MSAPEPETASRRRWAWRIGSLAQIPIYLHFTLLLLLAWVIWTAVRSGGAVAPRVLFVVGLFASVFLHELGHALMARRYGIRAAEIVLYPFGGVARLRSMGTPRQEFWISLAGPMVSILIGLVLLASFNLTGRWDAAGQVPNTPRAVLQWLMMANFVLAAFNLIPAFPLDGGRVLRALLAGRMGIMRATALAATVGQGFAILMGLAGLFLGHFFLMFIAFFVFISAGQEVLMQRSRIIMRGVRVEDAMITHYETVRHADTLGQAADLLLDSHQQDFPVLAGGEILGVLTRPGLVRGLADHGPDAYISGSTSRAYVALSPDDALQAALERMQAGRMRVALVLTRVGPGGTKGAQPQAEQPSADRLVGMLTEENIQEYLQVHEATGDASEPPRA